MLRWCADRIEKGKLKDLTSARRVETGTTAADEGNWFCKKQLYDMFGDEKGQDKIDFCESKKFDSKGKPLHRPDRDTGKDNEKCRIPSLGIIDADAFVNELLTFDLHTCMMYIKIKFNLGCILIPCTFIPPYLHTKFH